MVIGQHLELKQTQQLVMTPQLQQAIKLLQMSTPELTDYILSEFEQNPFLEFEEHTSYTPNEEPTTAARLKDDSQMLASSSSSNASSIGTNRSRHAATDEMNISDSFAQKLTLRESLIQQLNCSSVQNDIKLIIMNLIEYIDDAGYLRVQLEDIAQYLDVNQETVLEALKTFQEFEPVGVGARNLQECLTIQIKEKGLMTAKIQTLIDNIDLLAMQNTAKLTKLCQVSVKELCRMVDIIRLLNPRPGDNYSLDEPSTIIPDVYISQNTDGTWNIELNTYALPKILFNKSYTATLDTKSSELQNYISEKHQNANWLIRSIEQRANTILQVTAEIVRYQMPFMTDGIQHLRPLTLKKIAKALNIHESTVCRTISNKYMATPQGVVAMKFFFNSSIPSHDGENSMASEAVKQKIRTMISAEGNNILSDETIVSLCNAQGINIARRTVAKYRTLMGIPSSFERKRRLRSPLSIS